MFPLRVISGGTMFLLRVITGGTMFLLRVISGGARDRFSHQENERLISNRHISFLVDTDC